MKNLTFEQNIQQIAQNHSDMIRNSTEIQMGVSPEDLYLTGEELVLLFNSVREEVRLDGVRIYGLNMPIGFAVSDFGDHRITISVTDEPFNTKEGIRDYLVEQLISGHEVYVYSVNVVNLSDPNDFQSRRRYYLRCVSIHRSRWSRMTLESETNRDLHGRLPWDHDINTNGFNDTTQQLNRWLEEKQPTLNPKEEIKKHKF